MMASPSPDVASTCSNQTSSDNSTALNSREYISKLQKQKSSSTNTQNSSISEANVDFNQMSLQELALLRFLYQEVTILSRKKYLMLFGQGSSILQGTDLEQEQK